LAALRKFLNSLTATNPNGNHPCLADRATGVEFRGTSELMLLRQQDLPPHLIGAPHREDGTFRRE
jgi:hypothetical protein